MVWSHHDTWLLTGDHGGFVKYWQSNMNNVKMYEAHKEPIRGLRWAQVSSNSTRRENTCLVAIVVNYQLVVSLLLSMFLVCDVLNNHIQLFSILLIFPAFLEIFDIIVLLNITMNCLNVLASRYLKLWVWYGH